MFGMRVSIQLCLDSKTREATMRTSRSNSELSLCLDSKTREATIADVKGFLEL